VECGEEEEEEERALLVLWFEEGDMIAVDLVPVPVVVICCWD
jgi:preprotein translocase subunit Sec61beta